MHVDIIDFPETLVAALEHHGPENQTYKTSSEFIQWRKENGVPADICVSIENEVGENPQGVVNKSIPACRCAVARHTGSRDHVTAAEFLVDEWLPDSGEEMGDFPLFFHYVNVGPGVREQDMITDVYLSLK
jgi:AraC family transcriptional regulator